MFDIRITCGPIPQNAPLTSPTDATDQWPTPEQAYALAPSIISEIGWTTHTSGTAECYAELDRDYYLRRAALLDRIALLDEPDHTDGDATETAEAAALVLLDMDQPGVICDARAYVRQQYALSVKHF